MNKPRVVRELALKRSRVSSLHGFVFFCWAYGCNIVVFDQSRDLATVHLQDWLRLRGVDTRLIPLGTYEPDFIVYGNGLKTQCDQYHDKLKTLF